MVEIPQHLIARITPHIQKRTLREVYNVILDQAYEYRTSAPFVKAREDWRTWQEENPGVSNDALYSKYMIHTFYVKGLTEAAWEIAKILKISEFQFKKDKGRNRSEMRAATGIQTRVSA